MLINPVRLFRYHYRNPVVESVFVRKKTLVDGTAYFEADAYLIGTRAEQGTNTFYNNASGSGAGLTKELALRKAISEALEYEMQLEMINLSKVGTDIDPSSTGFAVFPGFLRSSAREYALSEAIERWGIAEWWAGNVRAVKVLDDSRIKVWELQTPFCDYRLVLICKYIEEIDHYTYGFACSRSFSTSLFKAKVEMTRNIRSLKNGLVKVVKPVGLNERRLFFFSTYEGYSHFMRRIDTGKSANRFPKILVDSYVEWKWSSIAHGWRVLLKTSNYDYLDESTLDFFYF